MPRHIELYMDDVALSSVGPVLVQQVHEDAPTLELMEGDRLGRYGQRLLGRKRQSLKVSVELAIRELFDLTVRARVMESIAAWAQGSKLEMSNRPHRCLMVACTGEPALTDVRDYTARIRIEWTAYTVPFWQDRGYTVCSMAEGQSGSSTLWIPGSVESPVSLSVTASAALTSFSVTVGGHTVAISGLSVPAGGVLEFGRDALDNLMISLSSVSQLSHRSAASDDDLMAPPGYVPISYTADAACTVTFKSRGRYL